MQKIWTEKDELFILRQIFKNPRMSAPNIESDA